MTSPIKPNLPCSMEQMRRHATIGGNLPRREAVALLDRVEQLEQAERAYRGTLAINCPEALKALDEVLADPRLLAEVRASLSASREPR